MSVMKKVRACAYSTVLLYVAVKIEQRWIGVMIQLFGTERKIPLYKQLKKHKQQQK